MKTIIIAEGFLLLRKKHENHIFWNAKNIRNDLSINTTKYWEAAFNNITTPKTRKIALRILYCFSKTWQSYNSV